jgi:diguanylate cyclase (GGDEF)-like protein
MLPNDIYNVYKMINGNRHPAGRFLVNNGKVHHLEDYYRELDVPEGTVDDYTIAKLTHPRPGQAIASDADMRSGKHLHLIPEADLAKPMPQPIDVTPEMVQQHLTKLPPPVWNYRRAGHDIAHTLEHHGKGKFSLDGNPLSPDELQTIALNLKNKSASIRYKGDGIADTIAKMEKTFSTLRSKPLAKEESIGHVAALRHLEEAENAGHVPKGTHDSLRRQIYTDPMTGGVMGNKFAYGEWLKKPRGGVHLALDANNFKQINDLYGHEAGDQSIQALGGAIRGAADEATERHPENAKVFRSAQDQDVHRIGGDEFQVWMPSHAHAASFARKLRDRLSQIPPVGGTHRLSMSIGMGHDPHSADAAVYEAKKQKQIAPGQFHTPASIPHVLAHSSVPGFEGAVPTEVQHLPKISMPEGAKVETPRLEEGQHLHTPKLPEPPAPA